MRTLNSRRELREFYHDKQAQGVPTSELFRLVINNQYLGAVRQHVYPLLRDQAQTFGYGLPRTASQALHVNRDPDRASDRTNTFRNAPRQGASVMQSLIELVKGGNVRGGKSFDLCQMCGHTTAPGENHTAADCTMTLAQVDHVGNSVDIFCSQYPYRHPGPLRFFVPANGREGEEIPLLYQPTWGDHDKRVLADQWATYVANARDSIRKEDRKEYDAWVNGEKKNKPRSRAPVKKSGAAGRHQ